MRKPSTTQAREGQELPLRLAGEVSRAANACYGSGEMAAKVSPVTRELLKYWFEEPFTFRSINFHAGQRQAILNAIYLHEVLGVKDVAAVWEQVSPELLELDGGVLRAEMLQPKYSYPKYCVKMATGTGKTWVMHALLIWQYLNARAEKGTPSGRWTRNFLFVAPGLIVYERLLDAFCGRQRDAEQLSRDFDTSDIKSCESLFVPPTYREALYGFLQNCVVRKEEFGHKVTGDGLLAVMNWHAFLGDEGLENQDEEKDTVADDDDGRGILDDLLPAQPGTLAGNALDSLDAGFLRGGRLDFLKELPDLMLVNDEAHHVHGDAAQAEQMKWQEGIDLLVRGKAHFMQFDFSATPYVAAGTVKNPMQRYFPHVMVNFDLTSAIRAGLVKAIAMDERKKFTDQLVTLDFNAVRDGRKVVGLSDGQRLMLRAGLTRLKYLEKEFSLLDPEKHPKMMVVCEDTNVTPFVEQYLFTEGLSSEDVLTIDSSRQGEVSEKEWKNLKKRLFSVDKRVHPKVLVSVLMLREGFDVNNVCVIVPLRATNAPILLEQTLGRGLRLMWREPEYQEVKQRARRQLLAEKTEPDAVLDFLYVIEHPNFVNFYKKLLENGLAGVSDRDGEEGAGISDLVKSELKHGHQLWDLNWPIVLRESAELMPDELAADDADLKPFTLYSFEQLRRMFGQEGEVFVAKELTVQTTFGAYRVHGSLFDAKSYNEYIQRVVEAVSRRFLRIRGRQISLPTMQMNLAQLAHVVDHFIRERLFTRPFDPFHDADWKLLLCLNGVVTQHIVQQIGELVYRLECRTITTPAAVRQCPFSQVQSFICREGSSLVLTKTIYTRTEYPARNGNLERDFLLFIDHDGGVERFVKINESKHLFARIAYLRQDGVLGEYIPDFLVDAGNRIYLVETKANSDKDKANVQAKRMAALEWCRTINALEPADRMGRIWSYLLLTDKDFYAYRNANATFADFCKFAELTENGLKGEFVFN